MNVSLERRLAVAVLRVWSEGMGEMCLPPGRLLSWQMNHTDSWVLKLKQGILDWREWDRILMWKQMWLFGQVLACHVGCRLNQRISQRFLTVHVHNLLLGKVEWWP